MPGTESAEGLLHDAVRREVLAPDLVLSRRQTEEDDRRDTELFQAAYLPSSRSSTES